MVLRVPCPQCGKFPPPACDCPPLPPGPPDPPPAGGPSPGKPRREVIRLRREKRAGREVIVIEGFPPDVGLGEVARALKSRCASGGTVKGGAIEIQGDHREKIAVRLRQLGYKTKFTGG